MTQDSEAQDSEARDSEAQDSEARDSEARDPEARVSDRSAARAPAGEPRSRPFVVVGIDGSSPSRAALVHALGAAARRRSDGEAADLEVVSSYAIALHYIGGVPLEIPDIAAIRDDTFDRARAMIDDVRAESAVAGVPGADSVQVRLTVHEGPAAQVLVDASAGAELLVVGSRGRGAMRSSLLGSVALHCATHAACPVVVVRPAPPDTLRPADAPARILVGVDGSAGSRAALDEAVAEAVRRDAALIAVTSYVPADHWAELPLAVVAADEQIRKQLQADLDELVTAAIARHGGKAVELEVRSSVVEGPAAEVLVERSGAADLLVVGSRGRGALRGLLLGSVALHAAMHASCPVTGVHPPR
jgi:nucleotide-binding universal stress UspA family protein